VHRYRSHAGSPDRAVAIRYWKPIQTGIEQDDDSLEVSRLGACRREEVWEVGVRLPGPFSPHLSAHLAGQRIDVKGLVAAAAKEPPSIRWIVEGAGGVLVPLNEHDLMADLMVALGLPVVVVARTTLGTINHTLLTLEALRARSLTIAGVFLVGDRVLSNTEAIMAYGRVPIVAELPRLNPLTPEALAQCSRDLDPDNHLAPWLLA
jgi:dethiobiotin synthetase